MTLIILQITHAMIRETRLPNRRPRFQPIRKSPFDELHDSLQRNLCRGRQQRVDMIGHDDEFVKKIFPVIAIVSQGIDQKPGDGVAPENGLAMSRNSSDKEDAVGVQGLSMRNVTICSEQSQNGTRGLKAVSDWCPQRGPRRAALPRNCRRHIVEERRFSAASEAMEIGTESRRDSRNAARVQNETHRQHRYPPLQRTQERGTHSCAVGEETKTERVGHPPVTPFTVRLQASTTCLASAAKAGEDCYRLRHG